MRGRRNASHKKLTACSLSNNAFATYGDVLDAAGAPTSLANGGAVAVHRDIAVINIAAEDGRVCVSVVRAKGATWPLCLEVMDRRPLGSQVIAPLGDGHMLVVVAPHGPLDPAGSSRSERCPAKASTIVAASGITR